MAAAAPRIEVAHLILVVAEIIGAQVAVIAKVAIITRIRFTDTVYADARTAIPVAGLTTGAPYVFARVFKGEVMSALVVVIARIRFAGAVHAYTVETIEKVVEAIEVASGIVWDVVAKSTLARIIGAFVLVVAVLRVRAFSRLTAPNQRHYAQRADT